MPDPNNPASYAGFDPRNAAGLSDKQYAALLKWQSLSSAEKQIAAQRARSQQLRQSYMGDSAKDTGSQLAKGFAGVEDLITRYGGKGSVRGLEESYGENRQQQMKDAMDILLNRGASVQQQQSQLPQGPSETGFETPPMPVEAPGFETAPLPAAQSSVGAPVQAQALGIEDPAPQATGAPMQSMVGAPTQVLAGLWSEKPDDKGSGIPGQTNPFDPKTMMKKKKNGEGGGDEMGGGMGMDFEGMGDFGGGGGYA